MSGINEQVINAEIYQIGPQGIPGEAATISIGTVTTGAAGSDASVTNSGTSSAAILDFVIPQGAQGLQGIQGPQGIQGLTGATGNGISSIAKTGTSGLVDTYRITFTDNTYFDFDVTNGSSISDIEKTGTSGLVDTYTITLTNGDTHTFTVTNGAQGEKGETGEVGNGVLGVTKMSTTGLVDNYRMTFTNGTYFDFDVANAKSITGISKTGTSGLTDTYTITFNDNTSTTYNIVNGRGVTNVALLSWEGLVKTYRMTFNDGTYFDYEVTNGAGGQTEWGGIAGVLSNQTDLQTALNDKMNNTQSHALKSYSDNGELLTDAEGLADVIKYAHSTFDSGKFTVVGSPVITDDGIASGFSNSNYITAPFSYITGQKFKITLSAKLPARPASGFQSLCNRWTSESYFFDVRYDSTGAIYFIYKDSNATTKILTCGTYNENDILNFSVTYANGSTTIITDQSYTVTDAVFSTYTGGLVLSSGTNPFLGSIDLKQFSITVDGVPVFSGNKTGIDTIKSDDYTVVGTPTISADGVASGFSNNDYLTASLSSLLPSAIDNVTFEGGFTYVSGVSAILGGSGSNNCPRAFVSNDNKLTFYLNDGSIAHAPVIDFSNIIRNGDRVEFTVTYSNTNITARATINNGTPLTVTNNKTLSVNFVTALATLYIGHFGSSYSASSIDLNAIKIYVNGSLVYQPCLKIPYIQSKTGSKVVNSVYRDRVNDMAEQFGYAPYYTLQEGVDFTLPQGELYGMIGQQTLRKSTVSGINRSFLYSDRTLLLTGSCTSGVEVTLPTAFSNANYMLSVPYSAKTATKFTPTQTGDWFAIGEGAL